MGGYTTIEKELGAVSGEKYVSYKIQLGRSWDFISKPCPEANVSGGLSVSRGSALYTRSSLSTSSNIDSLSGK